MTYVCLCSGEMGSTHERHESSQLPLAIKEKDVEYQVHVNTTVVNTISISTLFPVLVYFHVCKRLQNDLSDYKQGEI